MDVRNIASRIAALEELLPKPDLVMLGAFAIFQSAAPPPAELQPELQLLRHALHGGAAPGCSFDEFAADTVRGSDLRFTNRIGGPDTLVHPACVELLHAVDAAIRPHLFD